MVKSVSRNEDLKEYKIEKLVSKSKLSRFFFSNYLTIVAGNKMELKYEVET